jgi:protein gp37
LVSRNDKAPTAAETAGDAEATAEEVVMASDSKIEWTDHSASPWYGCAHRILDDGTPHPGCEHCYAEGNAKRNPGTLGQWGDDGTRVRSKSFIANLHLWNRKAAAAGKIVSVFPSICDPFEDWQGPILSHRKDKDGTPFQLYRFEGGFTEHRLTAQVAMEPVTMDDLRREMFQALDECPHVRLLLLTKRPENVRRMLASWVRDRCGNESPAASMLPVPNIAIGTSISDQATADELVPKLLACRDLGPVLFLSVEPLVGPVDLTRLNNGGGERYDALRAEVVTAGRNRFRTSDTDPLDWVIVGGESGHHARPMHPQWARDVRDQCTAAGVPFFFKQHGEWMPVFHGIDPNKGDPKCSIREFHNFADGQQMWLVGKKAAGRLLDGREWNELPAAFSMEAARA